MLCAKTFILINEKEKKPRLGDGTGFQRCPILPWVELERETFLIYNNINIYYIFNVQPITFILE